MSAPSQVARVMPVVTVESLLAELAAAKQARGGQQVASPEGDPKTQPKSRSLAGRVFACVCAAIPLLVLVCMSPYRDYVPSPVRQQVDRVIHLLG